MAANLFSLPLEIRLHIYSYLHAPSLELDLCEDLVNVRLANLNSPSKKRPSPLLSYLYNRSTATHWSRKHGIHLCNPEIPARLRYEYVSLIQSTNTALTVHCPTCLGKLFRHLVVDLGIKQPLIQHIRLRVDVKVTGSRRSWVCSVVDLIEAVKMKVACFYGSRWWDAVDDDGHRLRTWWIETVRTVGREPTTRRKHELLDDADAAEVDDDDDSMQQVEDDDDDMDSEDDNEAMNDMYMSVEDVVVLSKSTSRVDISNRLDVSDPESANLKDHIETLMRGVLPARHEDDWRRSRRLRRIWENRGKCSKRMVFREDVWISLQMR